MRKTKANIGMIELFYSKYEDEMIDEEESGLSPFIRSRVNHKKYNDEECRITEYSNGWTRISYSGCTITIPSKFIGYFESEKSLPKELRNIRKKGL